MSVRVKQRQIWSSDSDKTLKDELLNIHNNVGYIRASVAFETDLPVPEEKDGIIRLVREQKAIFQYVAATNTWERITQVLTDADKVLGGAYFREIHTVTDGQTLFTVKNPQSFDIHKMMVFIDGVLMNQSEDYHFVDARTIEYIGSIPLTSDQKLVFYIAGTSGTVTVRSQSVYEYNSTTGNISKITTTGDINRVTEFFYDANGENIIQEKVTDIITGEILTRNYEYDAVGNVSKVTDNGVEIYYISQLAQDAFDKLGENKSYSVSFSYDSNGRLSQEIYSNGINRRIEYFYNVSNKLDTKIIHNEKDTITEHYTYDANGFVANKEVNVIK